MKEHSSSKLTVEQLQSGEGIDILGILDISIFDIVVNSVLFTSLMILFLALVKIYKIKKISALKYLAIGFVIFILAIIIPFVILFITLLVPEIFDTYEGELETINISIVYISGFFGSLFVLIGALKLRKYANAL